MYIKRQTVVPTIGALLLLANLMGCAATNHQPTAVQIAEDANHVDADKAADQDETSSAEKRADDTRKLAKLDRDLTLAEHKLTRAKLARSHSNIKHAQAIATAQGELELQRQRQATFNDRSAPQRIEEARLDLARGEDRAKEADEELKQLEMMYAEEDFADRTKEIVLQRGRRNLARSLKSLELKREKLAILSERTLPAEGAEQVISTAAKERALEQAQRSADAAKLDQQIAVLSAKDEVTRLTEEIQTQRDKMAKNAAGDDDTE